MRRVLLAGAGAVGAAALAEVARRITQASASHVRSSGPDAPQAPDSAAGDSAGAPDAPTRRPRSAGRPSSTLQAVIERFKEARATREKELVTSLLVASTGGDAGAVLKRGRDGASGSGRHSTSRPSGRVDDDEPLYDF